MSSKREQIVIRTSIISILANVILASFKAIVGLITHSIAIISDAVNNFSDALSSIITIIGTKLAGKAPDKKHPYGYGRVEYITALVVSAIVFYAGITVLIESIKKIFVPEAAHYDTATLVILVVAILVKFILAHYVKRKGRDINSDPLVASGTDAFNDALLSASVLASALIDLWFGLSLEAYVGVLLAVFILRAGIKLIMESVDDMIGTRAETKLTNAIKREILKEHEIKGVFDLVLNDYGPGKYLGSAHIELPDTLTVAEVDKISRKITKRVSKKFGVILHTIGVYSISTKNSSAIAARQTVEAIVFSFPEVLQMHGFYLDHEDKTLSFDIIINFEAKDHARIYREIYDQVSAKFPKYRIDITLDLDVS